MKKPIQLVCRLILVVVSTATHAQPAQMDQHFSRQSADSILNWMHKNALEMEVGSFTAYAQLALRKSYQTEDAKQMADTHFSLARFYRLYFIYDSIQHHANKALSFYEQLQNQLMVANCYTELGYVTFNKLSFLTAEDYLMKAIAIYEDLGAQSELSRAYIYLAASYELSGSPEEAIRYMDSAYEVALVASDTTNIILSLAYATPSYIAAGQKEIALKKVNESLEWIRASEDPDPTYVIDVYYYRGDAFTAMGQLDSAWASHSIAFEMAQKKWENSNSNGALFYTDGLAYIHQLRGNYPAAIKMNNQLLEYLYRVGEYENLLEIYQRQAQCYQGIGDLQNALIQTRKAWHLDDSLKELRNKALASELEIRYETARREETIQNQQSQLARQQRIQNLTIGIALLVTLFLLVLYYFYRHNNRRKDELQRLNTSLSEKNELLDERNRQNETLLKEIHHRVKNNLEIVSSLLELQAAQWDDVNQKRAFQSCQGRIQSMSIVHESLYQKKNLATIEVQDYINKLSEHILETYASQGLIVIDCQMAPIELDLDTAIPIGLILNELLTNTLKYAFPNGRTGRVEINLLEAENGLLTLQVSDNGIGKTTTGSAKKKGFGSQLIMLLTKQLGGSMKEEVNNGTKVSLAFFPVNKVV